MRSAASPTAPPHIRQSRRQRAPCILQCKPRDAPLISPERSLERLDSLPEAFFYAANKQHVATCFPVTPLAPEAPLYLFTTVVAPACIRNLVESNLSLLFLIPHSHLFPNWKLTPQPTHPLASNFDVSSCSVFDVSKTFGETMPLQEWTLCSVLDVLQTSDRCFL